MLKPSAEWRWSLLALHPHCQQESASGHFCNPQHQWCEHTIDTGHHRIGSLVRSNPLCMLQSVQNFYFWLATTSSPFQFFLGNTRNLCAVTGFLIPTSTSGHAHTQWWHQGAGCSRTRVSDADGTALAGRSSSHASSWDTGRRLHLCLIFLIRVHSLVEVSSIWSRGWMWRPPATFMALVVLLCVSVSNCIHNCSCVDRNLCIWG